MSKHSLKTEHSGAKNGGGAHDTRETAKKTSKKRRRANGKAEVRKELRNYKKGDEQ